MHENDKSFISSEGGGSFPSSCLGVGMIIPFPVLMDVSKCFPNACMAAAVPSCHSPIPAASGKFGPEKEGYFVPDSAHGWHSPAQRRGEATEKKLHPRSLKETTAQVFYFQDQQPLLVLLFVILVLFFPFPVLALAVSIPSIANLRAVKHPGWLNILK